MFCGIYCGNSFNNVILDSFSSLSSFFFRKPFRKKILAFPIGKILSSFPLKVSSAIPSIVLSVNSLFYLAFFLQYLYIFSTSNLAIIQRDNLQIPSKFLSRIYMGNHSVMPMRIPFLFIFLLSTLTTNFLRISLAMSLEILRLHFWIFFPTTPFKNSWEISLEIHPANT